MSTVFQVCILENLSTASQDAGQEVPLIDILWQQNLRTHAKNVYSVTHTNSGRFTTAKRKLQRQITSSTFQAWALWLMSQQQATILLLTML